MSCLGEDISCVSERGGCEISDVFCSEGGLRVVRWVRCYLRDCRKRWKVWFCDCMPSYLSLILFGECIIRL